MLASAGHDDTVRIWALGVDSEDAGEDGGAGEVEGSAPAGDTSAAAADGSLQVTPPIDEQR